MQEQTGNNLRTVQTAIGIEIEVTSDKGSNLFNDSLKIRIVTSKSLLSACEFQQTVRKWEVLFFKWKQEKMCSCQPGIVQFHKLYKQTWSFGGKSYIPYVSSLLVGINCTFIDSLFYLLKGNCEKQTCKGTNLNSYMSKTLRKQTLPLPRNKSFLGNNVHCIKWSFLLIRSAQA